MAKNFLRAVNQACQKVINDFSFLPVVTRGKKYFPKYEILFSDKNNKQALICIIQPKKLKIAQGARAKLAQIFNFYCFQDNQLKPMGMEASFGKDQTLRFTTDKTNDQVLLKYVLNGREKVMNFNTKVKGQEFFCPTEIALKPDPAFWPQLVADEQSFLPMKHFLLATFLEKVMTRPALYGISEIKFLVDTADLKRGYLFFKKVRSFATDIIIKKIQPAFLQGEKLYFMDQVKLITSNNNYSELKELQQRFIKYSKNFSSHKLKIKTSEFLSLYKFFLPNEIKIFYFPSSG